MVPCFIIVALKLLSIPSYITLVRTLCLMNLEAGLVTRAHCSFRARFAALGLPVGCSYNSRLARHYLAVLSDPAVFNDCGWAKWVRLCWFGGKRLCALRQDRTFFFVFLLFYDSGVLKMEGKGKAKRKNNAPTSCMRSLHGASKLQRY